MGLEEDKNSLHSRSRFSWYRISAPGTYGKDDQLGYEKSASSWCLFHDYLSDKTEKKTAI